SSRKNYTLKYHLKIENGLMPVCKKMFSSTLHLGEWTIANWVKKSTTGIVSSTSKFPNKVQALNVEKRLQAMNIAVFQPRKDQCDPCFSHKQGNIETCDYETHIMDKDRVRVEEELDKENAIKGKVTVFTMDVQAVQLVPYLPAGM
ncbi:hypothetical protein CBL_21438, partial [Carabus blaptoides fortunei]